MAKRDTVNKNKYNKVNKYCITNTSILELLQAMPSPQKVNFGKLLGQYLFLFFTRNMLSDNSSIQYVY